METPIFKLIEKELISCREKIDVVINTLNRIDAHFKDKPDLALDLAQSIIKEADSRYIIDKIIKLQWRVNVGNFEEDK